MIVRVKRYYISLFDIWDGCSSPKQDFTVAPSAENPGLLWVENNVLNSLHTLDRVSPQNLQRHPDCILHDLCVIFEVENMDCSIIWTWGHQRVFFMETQPGYGFLVELHSLIGLGREVNIIAN